jgi:hypothetical protein
MDVLCVGGDTSARFLPGVGLAAGVMDVEMSVMECSRIRARA